MNRKMFDEATDQLMRSLGNVEFVVIVRDRITGNVRTAQSVEDIDASTDIMAKIENMLA